MPHRLLRYGGREVAMTIKDRLEADMKEAMRAKDSLRLGVIRMLRSKLLEREVELRGERGRDWRIDDAEALPVIASYAKQRRDSIEGYRQGGRNDLAAGEEAELAIVQSYLPEQMPEAEIRRLVDEAIAASGATSARDMGSVMKHLMPRVRGKADGAVVNRIVRERLGG
jgi:uncharacterized protein YqeY